jgi:predicted transcriptional regulator
MRRSKLELHIDIMNVLARYGQLKITPLMQKANINFNVAKENLEFLKKQGLVEEKIVGKNNDDVFVITHHGVEALKYFREINQAIPIFNTAENQQFPFQQNASLSRQIF